MPVEQNPPPLIWPDGRRMVRTDLVREVAGPTWGSVRSILSDHPENGLTPQRLARMLRESEEGEATAYLELAEAMEEKDLHYLAVLATRKRAVAQLPIEIHAAGDSPEEQQDADLIRAWVEREELETELFGILDAVGKGYSVVEIVWNLSERQWIPERLEWRDPRWFEFHKSDGRTIMLRTNTGPQPLGAAKFITHFHAAKSGLPIRGGLARAAAWSYLFKNYAMKDWVAFLEAFGLPIRVGRYDNGTSEGDIRLLMGALSQLGSDAAAVYPKSMDIEFIDGKQGTGPSELWKALCDYCDQQVSKAVLGQTASTDALAGGLGSGQSHVHNEVREDIERADARLLAATLNRDLVRPIIILNRGERKRYPRITIGRPEEHDVKALTEAVQALVPMGLKVGIKTVRDRIGIPEPEAGEEVLMAPVTAPSEAPAGARDASVGAASPTRPLLPPLKRPESANPAKVEDATASTAAETGDPLIDLAHAYADDWERQLEPSLSAIEAALAAATDANDAEARLAAIASELDVTALTQALARASFTARIAGGRDISVEQEAQSGT